MIVSLYKNFGGSQISLQSIALLDATDHFVGPRGSFDWCIMIGGQQW